MNHVATDYYEHPIFSPYEFLIDTPAIEQLKEVLDRWVWTGTTGGIIRGDARCGKTTAMVQITDRLQTRGGKDLPTHFFTVQDRDRQTINALYRGLSVSADLPINTRSQVEPMFSNIVSFFMERCLLAKTKQFVLIVDEAQRLSFSQYNAFAELHDFIREKFKTLFTVLFIVNSDEVELIFERVTDKQYRHIYGRFFKKVADFYGIRSEQEVKRCLRQYDILRFPVGSGPTYTQFFLSKAVNRGWRYASLSPTIWATFREYQKDYRLTSWGMESFICTANILLYDFLPQYGPDQCDHEMVRGAIEASGLIPSLVKPCH